MQVVPKYYMGRVQNTFAMASRTVQMALAVALGWAAQSRGLIVAFALLAFAYGLAVFSAALAGRPNVREDAVAKRAAAARV
jgi:hypothetical protein